MLKANHSQTIEVRNDRFRSTVLRLIHIFSAVYWAGSSFFFVGVVAPSADAAGAEGGKFMQRLVQHAGLTKLLPLTAGLTALSGILLYWRASAGLQIAWITSGPGLALTIGGLAGLAAAVEGGAVLGPASQRLEALAQEIEAQGGPPSQEQQAQFQMLQEKVSKGGIRSVLLFVVALVGMSIAQTL